MRSPRRSRASSCGRSSGRSGGTRHTSDGSVTERLLYIPVPASLCMQDVHSGEVASWVVCGHREGHSKACPAVRMQGRGLLATFLLRFPGLVQAAELPIARNLELDALQEAVRWPHPSPRTVLTLAGQFLASRRADEGYTFFQERATSQPDQPLFLALEGLFQAGMAGAVPLPQRGAWVQE